MRPESKWFVVAEPTNPPSWNMDAYALNNPLANVDPAGLDRVYFNSRNNGVESVDRKLLREQR